MIISKNDLLSYKATKSANNYLTLPSPAQVLEPVFSVLDSHVVNYNCHVQEPTRQAVEATGVAEYKIADRVLIEAVLDDNVHQVDNDVYRTVIGVLYAHDVQKPIIKMYLGFENHACLNLSVFNSIDIAQKEFAATDFNTIYENIPMFLDKIEQRKEQLREATEFLMLEQLSGDSLHKVIGEVGIKAYKTIAMKNHYSQMIDNLVNSKSRYFKQSGEYTRYDLYQAMTDSIDKNSIIATRPDKVLNAYNFFK